MPLATCNEELVISLGLNALKNRFTSNVWVGDFGGITWEPWDVGSSCVGPVLWSENTVSICLCIQTPETKPHVDAEVWVTLGSSGANVDLNYIFLGLEY